MTAPVTKRCTTCGRFRAYEPDDAFCLVCGTDSLDAACACGRPFDYALAEEGDLHCPRCGLKLRGRASEFDA
jgi:hypothetical protein